LLAKKVVSNKHHEALPYVEIPAFMAELRQWEGVVARAIEFTILTASRTEETTGATWDEIDLGAKLWTVPDWRMKARREHRVPLSGTAIALLEALPRLDNWVFQRIQGEA
jgi:integrase